MTHNGTADAAATSHGREPEGVHCDCCETPLPIGTRAKIDPESGAIICLECCDALGAVQ